MAEQNIRHLVRIMNTDLNGSKPVHHALRGIKGVGVSFSHMVIALAGIDKFEKIGALSDDKIALLDKIIRNPSDNGAPGWMLNRRRDFETNTDKHLLTGDMAFIQGNDVKRLRKIKSYRGNRHARGVPVRGQRTRSNFRKNKGKVTLGVQRKKGKK